MRVAYKSKNKFHQTGTATSMPQHSVIVVQQLVCHNQSGKNITKLLSQCRMYIPVTGCGSVVVYMYIHGWLPKYSLWQLDVCIDVCVYVCMYVCVCVCTFTIVLACLANDKSVTWLFNHSHRAEVNSVSLSCNSCP